jgi:hypothetical protein
MSYVIRRTDQGGGFVADMRVSNGSYTHMIQRAKVFATEAAADAERCVENEVVDRLDHHTPQPRRY